MAREMERVQARNEEMERHRRTRERSIQEREEEDAEEAGRLVKAMERAAAREEEKENTGGPESAQ